MSIENTIRVLFVIYFIGLAVVTVIPLGGLSTSLSGTKVLSLRMDYLLHALVFLPLVPLWKLAKSGHPLVAVVMAGIGIAALAEISHLWIPYRGYNINDLLGNVLGAVLGWPLYLLVRKYLPAKAAK